ncbi:MAG: type II secretion system minor pseudopilin GspK [Thermodesulfovibrionales bacterium]
MPFSLCALDVEGGSRVEEDTARQNNNRGMALVLTLMVVTLITAMVVEFAYGVYVSTSALHNWQTSQQLSLAARSATQLATRLIVEQKTLTPNYPGVFENSQTIPFEELEGTISIRIEDENARFNINTLVPANGIVDKDKGAYPSFIRLLNAVNLKPEIAARIVDWIDPDSIPTIQGAEDGAKNGPLDSIDELLAIPGIEPEAFERLQPYVTIYTSGQVNINSASVPVLMSLSDAIDRKMAENIARYREITPFEKIQDIFKVGTGLDTAGMFLMSHTTNSNTFRIVATATSGDIKRIIESVVFISGSSRTVLYWKEY